MLNQIKKFKIEIVIFLIFVLMRLPALGHDVFNTDVWKWKSRTYDFGTGVFTLDFEKTVQKYHPGVSLMWVTASAVKVYNFYSETVLGAAPADNTVDFIFGLHATQKTAVVLVLGVTFAFVIYPLRKMFGTTYALIAAFLVAFEPFYVALTRVMHLEGLMSTFMLASFVWLYYFLSTQKRAHFILSALLGSLAFLTKTSSVFLIPFSFLLFFIGNFRKDKKVIDSIKRSLKPGFAWVGVSLVGFIIFWPAMYTHMSLALETIYRGIFTIGVERGHAQIFLSEWVDDPGPSFYFIVLGFKSSLVLLLGVLGSIKFAKKTFEENDKKWFAISSLAFFTFYLIEMTLPSKKLDRYILPSLISLALIVAFYYEWLFDALRSKGAMYLGGGLALLIGFSVYTLSYLHPNYFSYYSPLLGGLKTGVFAIEPKWMLGQSEIVAFFDNELANDSSLEVFGPGESFDALINTKAIDRKLTIGFGEKYYTQIWPFVEEMGGRASIKDITAQAKETRYFVYPVYDDDSYLEDRFDIEKTDTIKLRGFDLYNVYKRID